MDIDRRVPGTLGGIDHSYDAGLAGALAKVAGRVDRAERVGDVCERQQLGQVELLVEFGEIKCSVVTSDRDEVKFGTGTLGQELPRHDVAMVLHLGQQDRVAFTEIL